MTDTERDPGFHDIQRDFDSLRNRHLNRMLKGLKTYYNNDYFVLSMDKVKKDIKSYKDQVDKRVKKCWLTLRSPAFNRLLKSRGFVAEGTSKARGLETTVNWNLELATILKPGFQSWYMCHSANMRQLRAALPVQINQLYVNAVKMINRSQANLIVVEKAKLKLRPYQLR